MKAIDKELLLRWLDDELSKDERDDLGNRLSGSAELRAQLDELKLVRNATQLSTQRVASRAVRPLLSDRVLARLNSSARAAEKLEADDLARFLMRAFRPVLVLGLLLAVVVAAYNVSV